jgi:hypothetical protein
MLRKKTNESCGRTWTGELAESISGFLPHCFSLETPVAAFCIIEIVCTLVSG